jgi:hypothetical protein
MPIANKPKAATARAGWFLGFLVSWRRREFTATYQPGACGQVIDKLRS